MFRFGQIIIYVYCGHWAIFPPSKQLSKQNEKSRRCNLTQKNLLVVIRDSEHIIGPCCNCTGKNQNEQMINGLKSGAGHIFTIRKIVQIFNNKDNHRFWHLTAGHEEWTVQILHSIRVHSIQIKSVTFLNHF
jgi:hypothetical protein